MPRISISSAAVGTACHRAEQELETQILPVEQDAAEQHDRVKIALTKFPLPSLYLC